VAEVQGGQVPVKWREPDDGRLKNDFVVDMAKSKRRGLRQLRCLRLSLSNPRLQDQANNVIQQCRGDTPTTFLHDGLSHKHICGLRQTLGILWTFGFEAETASDGNGEATCNEEDNKEGEEDDEEEEEEEEEEEDDFEEEDEEDDDEGDNAEEADEHVHAGPDAERMGSAEPDDSAALGSPFAYAPVPRARALATYRARSAKGSWLERNWRSHVRSTVGGVWAHLDAPPSDAQGAIKMLKRLLRKFLGHTVGVMKATTPKWKPGKPERLRLCPNKLLHGIRLWPASSGWALMHHDPGSHTPALREAELQARCTTGTVVAVPERGRATHMATEACLEALGFRFGGPKLPGSLVLGAGWCPTPDPDPRPVIHKLRREHLDVSACLCIMRHLGWAAADDAALAGTLVRRINKKAHTTVLERVRSGRGSRIIHFHIVKEWLSVREEREREPKALLDADASENDSKSDVHDGPDPKRRLAREQASGQTAPVVHPPTTQTQRLARKKERRTHARAERQERRIRERAENEQRSRQREENARHADARQASAAEAREERTRENDQYMVNRGKTRNNLRALLNHHR
jgi:hypothetical protein